LLKLESIAAWLEEEHGFSAYFHYGDIDRVPKGHHNLYCLTETGGFGLMSERALDRPTFQVMTQGAGGETALQMAYRLDSALIDAVPPLSMGEGSSAMHVVDIGRVGGPPAYVGRDDRNHVVYSASYWISVGR
jgi:hypothetical protein